MWDRRDRCDVAVVGGGIAGLVAAALAAREGASVVLLDPRPLGGRARTTRRGGFRFNQGPHALMNGGETARVLRALGVPLAGGPPRSDDTWWWYRGEAHRFPTGAGSLVTSRGLPARAKIGLAKVLATAPRTDTAALAGLTAGEWVDGLRLPEEGAALLHTLVRTVTYANAPGLFAADAAVEQLRCSLAGVTYLDGGWQSVVDALAGVARAAGADVRAGTGAAGLTRAGGGWSIDLYATDRPAPAPERAGVEEDDAGEGDAVAQPGAGGLTAAAVVLAAGSPARSAALLGDDPGWTATAGPAVHASCLDLGVAAPARRSLLFGADEPFYLSTHAPPADLAPEGLGVVHVAEYLRPGAQPDAATGRARLHEHARRAGVQDEAVVTERYLHRLPVTHGMPLASQGGLHGRPPVAVPGHEGLFVAGDWVGPRGLLADAATASATDAARAAVRHASRVRA